MQVFVVTGFDLGWDNVCGIYDANKVTLEELRIVFPSGDYDIQVKQVESDTSNW